MPRELVLDTRAMEPWELAARLDVILAYPEASEQRFGNIVTSRCAEQIAVTIMACPERRTELLNRYPAYDPRKSRTASKNFSKLRDDGLKAGAIFLAMIQEAATGELPKLKGKTVKPVLDLLVPKLWPRLSGEDEEKYLVRKHDLERRQVRRRYPVAHLAAALQSLAREQNSEYDNSWNTYDYQDLEFLRKWVKLALEAETYIRKTPNLKNMAKQLIHLRWIE